MKPRAIKHKRNQGQVQSKAGTKKLQLIVNDAQRAHPL